jgi:tetratricopeptide (TPR) repeat protein
MNPNRQTGRVAALVLILSMAGSMIMLHAIDCIRQGATLQESLYLRSTTALRRMSLGYTGLLADVYWTRAVQYFGSHYHENAQDFSLLAPLLQITTELDPRLLPAYELGANFLSPKPPHGAGRPDEALALMKYGVEHNPEQWRLYYDLGFLYYTEFKDYAGAADAFARGARLPVTNQYMPILAARMAQHAGEFDTARMLWYTTYQNSKEAQIRQNALEHLQALRVDEDVTNLEAAVTKYQQQTGRLPASMQDLERAGFFRETPVDPTGHPYKLMPDGHIEVEEPERILFISKGLPPGMDSPQPNRLNRK